MGAKNPLTGGIETDHELNMESAKRLEQDAQYSAAQRRRVADRLVGEQISAIAANNIELSGSALQAVQEDRVDAEIEAMNIVYTGKYQAADLRARSKNQRTQAYVGLVKEAGMAYMTSGASLGAKAGASKDALGGTTSYSKSYASSPDYFSSKGKL